MKKYFLYIFIYIAAGANLACSDSWNDKYLELAFEATSAATLSVNADVLEFPDHASSQQVEIRSNSRWTAVSSANWLTLSSNYGNRDANLTVSAEVNTSTTQERTGNITISNGVKSFTVSVKQLAKQESLEVSPLSLSYSFNGGQEAINVSANVSWTVISSASWLTVSKDAEGLSFSVTAAKNISTDSRQATITVKGISMNKSIEVMQTGVQAPSIDKLTILDITKHEATCRISANSHNIDITEYGICYSSMFQTPNQANADVLNQTGAWKNLSHDFRLTGLSSRTTYYVRPYIVTELGTLFGETVQFTTPASAPNEGDNGIPKD